MRRPTEVSGRPGGACGFLICCSVLLAALATFNPGQPVFAQPSPPIVDVHFHADYGWGIGAFAQLLDTLGVAMAGSGPIGPDTLGLSFVQASPRKFFTFGAQGSLVALIHKEGARIWNLQSPNILNYLSLLEEELRGGQIKGIGEIFVNNINSHSPTFKPIRFPGDAPLMQRLMSLSTSFGVPVQVHAEADGATVAEMERLLDANPQGTLIWAHTGFFAEPALLRRLFQRHSNLFCELSWRDERPIAMKRRISIPISDGGRLKAEWKAFLEEFPDRFVIGTDVGNTSFKDYASLISYWRGILQQLSPETAEKLAHLNAERIVKLP